MKITIEKMREEISRLRSRLRKYERKSQRKKIYPLSISKEDLLRENVLSQEPFAGYWA